MLTLLTPTGSRPQAWAQCQRWMQRQTYTGPVHWVVIDDGEQPQDVAFERDGWTVEVVRRKPHWQHGQNTQAANLLAGLDFVHPQDWLAIIEDDDAYLPNYLSTVTAWLQFAELVGETHARYYNVPQRRYRQLTNSRHASLCSTALRGPAIAALRNLCQPGVQYIDVNLWSSYTGSKGLHKTQHTVGMKGLPGRGGIGMGHKKDFQGFPDQKGSVLKQWIGDFSKDYTQ
jgi:hypothetical protein